MKKNYSLTLLTLGLTLSFNANAAFVNGSFETPRFTPGVADWTTYSDRTADIGWRTTATDHKIELWSDNFQGIAAYDGAQFAELNANQVSTLYQDVAGIAANNIIDFHFAHRGRLGIDTMRFDIVDLGANNVLGGGDDTTLFSRQYSDNNTTWGFYTSSGLAPILTLGHTLRFSFISIAAAGGSLSVGNFLDAADFSVSKNTSPVPVPAAFWLFAPALAGLGILGKRRTA
ncbi:VPLPA-CTERM sorting domain-containing protein [Methylobacter sp. YRD-M1]|uniref:VPLPA-CTERM sorting domain-containing protein n=1 Tax=Methylobacter sp. YRD-M1 TaxID=2911520 RepID=UPI00227D48EB|nr:VPLPA-CTERM sorting domain-containing protein [Methylobacter sp. YRD-M1]WAK02112.1 VPLPA-CTERM sorting domain-containing protein [Methylobacter sp. YRD-M1]